MSIDGKYKVVKDENVYEYLIATGFSETEAKFMSNDSAIMEISHVGDTYTYRIPLKDFTIENHFTINQEFIEKTGPAKGFKTVVTLEDGKLVISGTKDGVSVKRIFEKLPNGQVLYTSTSSLTPIISKRYMEPVE